ncbi:hypothetical protein BH18ACI5_BH18ACI5_16970 [soil metagenome]
MSETRESRSECNTGRDEDRHTGHGRTARTLWTVADWRCELHDGRWMRLLKDGQLVSEQLLGAGKDPEDWGLLWRAAIADVEVQEF